MKTIAVVNQKGGVGKTTVSINLASALAGSGKKTLLVDMDSQSHCAVGLAVPEDQIEELRRYVKLYCFRIFLSELLVHVSRDRIST